MYASRRYAKPAWQLISGHEKPGYGRYIELTLPITLRALIKRLKVGLKVSDGCKNPTNVKSLTIVKLAQVPKGGMARSIAICAGSGASVFKEMSPERSSILVTGEMSHHEVLYHKERGRHVLLCGHTETERGFLEVLKKQLQTELDSRIGPDRVEVIVSRKDRSPWSDKDYV
jgi:putative NIF3 family GTP cyclohydrolase 1 type 2